MKYFEVSDIQTNKKIGAIYVDLYECKNKCRGLWKEQIIYGDSEKRIPHISVNLFELHKIFFK